MLWLPGSVPASVQLPRRVEGLLSQLQRAARGPHQTTAGLSRDRLPVTTSSSCAPANTTPHTYNVAMAKPVDVLSFTGIIVQYF